MVILFMLSSFPHRTFVNGSSVSSPIQLHHGDRILWGNNHFFRYDIAHIPEKWEPIEGPVLKQKSHCKCEHRKMTPHYVCSCSYDYVVYIAYVFVHIYVNPGGLKCQVSSSKVLSFCTFLYFSSQCKIPYPPKKSGIRMT